MRVTEPQPRAPAVFTLARLFCLGGLAGWTLLAICLTENVSNLGYAVLAGGFWTLVVMIAAFGLAGAALGAMIGLLGLWQAHGDRPGVASMQLAPLRAPRRVHPSNQALR